MQLSVSCLGITEHRKEHILKLSNEEIDFLHIDVMDGKFVENKTESVEEIKKVIPISAPLDIHLMVENPIPYIEEYASLKPHYITIHSEIEGLLKGIDYIKSKNVKVGISIKPNTSIQRILPYLSFIDLILVMTVEPGKGGQKLIPCTLNKVNELKRIREIHNYTFKIEVDGGINDRTIKLCKGADIVVVGSYITNSYDYKGRIKTIKESI